MSERMTKANLTTEQKHWLEDVRRQSRKMSNWTQQRNEAIRRAHHEGVPAPTIAEAAGLTRVRIYQIIGRS